MFRCFCCFLCYVVVLFLFVVFVFVVVLVVAVLVVVAAVTFVVAVIVVAVDVVVVAVVVDAVCSCCCSCYCCGGYFNVPICNISFTFFSNFTSRYTDTQDIPPFDNPIRFFAFNLASREWRRFDTHMIGFKKKDALRVGQAFFGTQLMPGADNKSLYLFNERVFHELVEFGKLNQAYR